MKNQLHIRIIMIWLFCVVCSVNTDFPQEQFLNDLNGLRRDFANIQNISEIYELIWSYILEEKIKDGQGVLKLDRNTSALIDKLSNISRGFEFRSIYDMLGTENGVELLTPGQKEIGCADNGSVIYCLMGPDPGLTSWSNIRRTTPGSSCGRGYWNNRGLCSVETTTTAETKTTETTETTAKTTTETMETTKTTIGSTMRNSIAPIPINQKRSTPLLIIQRSANSINGRRSQNKGISAEDDEQSGVPWLFYISLFIVLCIFFKCAVFNSV